MSLVAHHVKEDYITYGPLYRKIYEFSFHEVGKRFQISLTDYLNLPPYMMDMLVEIAEFENGKKLKSVRNVLDNMGDLNGG